MKNWFFLGMQLVVFDGVGATFEGGSPLHFFRKDFNEFVECIDGRLVLSRYNGDSLVGQYKVALREGSFLCVQSCDVTAGLGDLVSDAELKIGASKVVNNVEITVCGEVIILHWREKMIILHCEALIGGEKEIFEFDYASFCDLDGWCKQVRSPYKKWFRGSQRDRCRPRSLGELAQLRKRAIEFNYSEARIRPLTEEEVDQYFRGIEVIAGSDFV